MRRRFKINDYVVYDGDETKSKSIKDKDYAKIIDIKTIDNKDWIVLELVSLGEEITCPKNKISLIDTTKSHLKKIGFKEEFVTKNLFCFVKDSLVVSNFSFGIQISKYKDIRFNVDFCLGDFRNITNNEVDKYIINGNNEDEVIVDLDKFNSDFPDLENINDLFNVIESKGSCIIDREKIITSVSLI